MQIAGRGVYRWNTAAAQGEGYLPSERSSSADSLTAKLDGVALSVVLPRMLPMHMARIGYGSLD